MKFLFIVAAVFASSVVAQNGCGFPDGPDCVSLGEGANGLEQFIDDGCCLLPFRCGNGDGGERCERVSADDATPATNTNGGRGRTSRNGNNRRRR
ncbi:hypothetical protein B0O99DRAFT_634555 [Bisporella sp. PMI_857]|nr:hypothetical protein B0O99DRAFT_634555 [Bisporella sp. PMI_857]